MSIRNSIKNKVNILIIPLHLVFFPRQFFQCQAVGLKPDGQDRVIVDLFQIKLFLFPEGAQFFIQLAPVNVIVTVEKCHPDKKCQGDYEVFVNENSENLFYHGSFIYG